MIYGTVDEADAYNIARGRAVEWEDADDKNAALLLASEYIDANYGTLFSGYKTGGRAQVRQWPRTSAWINDGGRVLYLDADEIPVEVRNATYELALRAASGVVLSLDVTPGAAIKKAAVEGAVSVEYHGSGSVSDAQTVFPVVDGILAPLLTAVGSGFSSLSGSRVRV